MAASGLKVTDTVVGTGATPKSGQTCVMHYTGWLYETAPRAEVRQLGRSRRALRVHHRRRPSHRGLGSRRRHHEGRRQAHARHSGRARLRRTRRRRRHPAERDVDLRRRAAGRKITSGCTPERFKPYTARPTTPGRIAMSASIGSQGHGHGSVSFQRSPPPRCATTTNPKRRRAIASAMACLRSTS